MQGQSKTYHLCAGLLEKKYLGMKMMIAKLMVLKYHGIALSFATCSSLPELFGNQINVKQESECMVNNPSNPKIKVKILICCPYTFPI